MKTKAFLLFLSHICKSEFQFVNQHIQLPLNSPITFSNKSLDFYSMYNLIAGTIPPDRKQGRYFTPPTLAEYLVREIKFNKFSTFLEPSAGLGIFLFKLLDRAVEISESREVILNNITLIEKNNDLAILMKLLFLHYEYLNKLKFPIKKLNIINGDFLTMPINNAYSVILGNPPFIDTKFLPDRKKYKQVYFISKRNLFSMFLEKSLGLTEENGEIAFIVSESFVFLRSYYNIREWILKSRFGISIHKLGKNNFAEANIGSLILHLNARNNGEVEIYNEKQKTLLPKRFFYVKDYILPFNDFPQGIINILKKNDNLSNHLDIMVGLQTNNVKRYVLKQFKIGAVPYIKRLKRRESYWQDFHYWLWIDKLIEEHNYVLKKRHRKAMNTDGVVFNNIDCDSIFIAVYKPKKYLFDIVTPCIIPGDIDLYYLLAYLNSHLAQYILYKLNGTPHTNINDVLKLPYNTNYDSRLPELAKESIEYRKRGIDISIISKEINKLIYNQFNVSSMLISNIETKLYENRIIFDKIQ